MTSVTQSVLALAAVSVAAAYLARRAWTTWRAARAAARRRPGCGPSCGCS